MSAPMKLDTGAQSLDHAFPHPATPHTRAETAPPRNSIKFTVTA